MKSDPEHEARGVETMPGTHSTKKGGKGGKGTKKPMGGKKGGY